MLLTSHAKELFRKETYHGQRSKDWSVMVEVQIICCLNLDLLLWIGSNEVCFESFTINFWS